MKKIFYLVVTLLMFMERNTFSVAAQLNEPPFVSQDTIETFLDVIGALKAKDFAKATEIIIKNPEVLDSTVQLKSLYKLMAADPKSSMNQPRGPRGAPTINKNKPKSEELSYAFLQDLTGKSRTDEHHILDIAAQLGNLEFVEFVFGRFLERNNVPMPSYSTIEKCAKTLETNIADAAFCLQEANASMAKNPLVVAAEKGHLKIVKFIVEFVKKYYKERGIPIPGLFFNSGFLGSVWGGSVPEIGAIMINKAINQVAQPVYVLAGPLLLALYYGYKDVAQYLINEGALEETPQQKQYGLLPGDGYLPVAFYDDPAASQIVYQGYNVPAKKSYTVDLAKYARGAGLTIPVSASDLERLSRAVKNNDLAEVKKLVLANKDLVLNRDKEGMLPIEWAGNKLAVVQFLKEQGSKVPETLLYFAFGSGSLPVAKWLVEELKMDPKNQLEKLIDVARRNAQNHMLDYLVSLGLKV